MPASGPSTPRRPRILAAGTSVAIENFTRALEDHAEIIPAHSVREALDLCDAQIDAVVCNVRFDESRMFEFLQGLAERNRERRMPVICVRMLRNISPATLAAVVEALEVLGVTRFLDLYELRERDGMDAALEALRIAVLEECAKAK